MHRRLLRSQLQIDANNDDSVWDFYEILFFSNNLPYESNKNLFIFIVFRIRKHFKVMPDFAGKFPTLKNALIM